MCAGLFFWFLEVVMGGAGREEIRLVSGEFNGKPCEIFSKKPLVGGSPSQVIILLKISQVTNFSL